MDKRDLGKSYEYDEINKRFILDVQLEDYRDAYSDWDFSPFTNRDLDEDLTEYLLECSYEIPMKYDLLIKFYILNQEINQKREDRSIKGMHNYFEYQLRRIKKNKLRVLREIVSYTFIGGILLTAGYYLESHGSESIFFSVLDEGLFIGGWVMLWEMFSAWFFDMKKIINKGKHFERLNNSKIIYSYGRDAVSSKP
ncbi:hypothetical protein JR334_04005 [Clostridia bacterium]|nr:hypothetical protein JR334_04005 [Clostridia bacterium]